MQFAKDSVTQQGVRLPNYRVIIDESRITPSYEGVEQYMS